MCSVKLWFLWLCFDSAKFSAQPLLPLPCRDLGVEWGLKGCRFLEAGVGLSFSTGDNSSLPKEKSASSWSSTCHLCGQSVLTAVNCQTYPKSLGTFPPSVFLRDLCQEGRVGEKSCHVQIPCCLLPSLLPTMILEMNLFQARWNLCLLFFRLEWHFIRLFPKIHIIFGPWWAWSCRCVHCWVWLLLQRCCRNVLRENVMILGKICVWAVSVWCWEKDWAFLK